jgi:hypothetical protein
MKLACIEHYRCDEPAAHTYVWVEPEWSEEQFEEAVERAEKAYNEALKAYKEQQGEDPYPRGAWPEPDYKDFPDMTVAEVQKIHEEKRAEREKWKATKTRALRPFSRFLEDEGLVNFYSVDAEYETTVWWGHRHGERLDYEDTDPNKSDPREIEPRRKQARRVHRSAGL